MKRSQQNAYSVVDQHRTQHNTTQHNTTQHNTTQHNTYALLVSVLDLEFCLLDSNINQITKNLIDIATMEADLCEFGGFNFEERCSTKIRKTSGNLHMQPQ
jgi:hypothetical protein